MDASSAWNLVMLVADGCTLDEYDSPTDEKYELNVPSTTFGIEGLRCVSFRVLGGDGPTTVVFSGRVGHDEHTSTEIVLQTLTHDDVPDDVAVIRELWSNRVASALRRSDDS